MDTSSEAVLGEIPVTAILGIGSERLRLVLTSYRLIVAHLGKRGVGATAAVPLLGKLAAALEDFLKIGSDSRKKQEISISSPQGILAADRDNFYISYEDIVRVEISELDRFAKSAGIMILTKDDKFQFKTPVEVASVAESFGEVLGEKVVASKAGPLSRR